MTENNDTKIRSILLNREVGWVFGVLTIFVAILRLISVWQLDPFASILVRLLLIPGYVALLGYAILLVQFFPEVGQIGWLLGFVIYLYVVSVVIGGVYNWYRAKSQ